MNAVFDTPWGLLKLGAGWLGASLVVVFFASMLIGPGGYGGGILAGMLILPLLSFSWLILLFLAGKQCWHSRFGSGADRKRAAIAAILPFGAATLLLALTLPVVWCSGRLQILAILLVNKNAYDHAVAEQALKPLPGRDAILVWPWGGSVDSDLDIVWDPLDRPNQRLPQKEGGGDADCHHLLNHYYECGIGTDSHNGCGAAGLGL